MSSKKKTRVSVLPARPEPPEMNAIHEEVQKLATGDVVFTMIKKILEGSGDIDNEVSMMDISDESSAASPSAVSTPLLDKQQTLPDHVKGDVNDFYNKVTHFMELNKDLRAAPETLKAHYLELQEMGSRLSKAIHELRSQVEATDSKAPCR